MTDTIAIPKSEYAELLEYKAEWEKHLSGAVSVNFIRRMGKLAAEEVIQLESESCDNLELMVKYCGIDDKTMMFSVERTKIDSTVGHLPSPPPPTVSPCVSKEQQESWPEVVTGQGRNTRSYTPKLNPKGLLERIGRLFRRVNNG